MSVRRRHDARSRVLIQTPCFCPSSDLESPEGIAVDHASRLLFWTDSLRDTVEVSKLDGSQRRVLFHTDLVNPRAIVTNPGYGFGSDRNPDWLLP